MTDHAGRLFCFGLGYSATVLGRRLRAAGWRVAGTSRMPAAAKADGISVFAFSREQGLDGAALASLANATHILVSIPPDDDGDPVIDLCGEEIAASGPRWIGYLSSTGVYGDHRGARVTEESPLNPTSGRAGRRQAAEQAWRTFTAENELPLQIFRLAGIYGPGRSVFDRVRAGSAQRIDRPDHLFGRIHVDDIAAIVTAAMDGPRRRAVYNVSDDEPAPPEKVVAYACELLGAPLPPLIPFEEAAETMSPMAQSFWRDRRIVDNGRLKSELGMTLAYPTYREGLRAVLRAEEDTAEQV